MGVDPVSIALVGGAAIQMYGQWQASQAEEDAHRQNARFLKEQQKLAARAAQREAEIFRGDADAFIGSQAAQFSKAGVDMSGSALMAITQSRGAAAREHASILEQGKRNVQLAGMRAMQSQQAANDLSRNRPIQAFGQGLSAAGSILGSSRPGPSAGAGLPPAGGGGSGFSAGGSSQLPASHNALNWETA
jgi:hypothetical protein